MQEPRHILLALCGITPQIITETLYCLMIQHHIPICKIWLLTTQKGREIACQTLLPSETGYLSRFCRDFGIAEERIKLTVGQILASNDVLDIQNIKVNKFSNTFHSFNKSEIGA